ncbi:MAG: MFS transporter [Ilumatobacteraceae bacterium]|nr:MFS transporter [Ilumatobacteraceae bacterium]
MSRFGTRTQLLLDAVVVGYFLPIGMLFVGVSRFVREEMDGSEFVVGVATTTFFVSAIVVRPWAGRVMDRIGRRPFIWPPLIAMAATTLLIPASTASWMVVVLRLLQGAAGAALYTALAATATDIAPPGRRGAAMARLSVMVYVGFAVGPFVGEYLFDQHHWWLFAAAGGIMALASGLALALPETGDDHRDAAGAEVPARQMMAAVLRPGLAQFTMGFGYACLVSFLTRYSREVGLGPSGWLFLTFAACTLVVRAVSGPMGDRVGYAKVALPGVVCTGIGLALMATAWDAWVAFPAIALVGVGYGGCLPALTALAAERAPERARAAALGTFFSFNDMGSATAGPLVGWIAGWAGFRWAYGTPAIVLVAGAVVAVTLVRQASVSSATPGRTPQQSLR